MSETPWTANNASSTASPNRKGFIEVFCRRARMDVLMAIVSDTESVSDLPMRGMTFVKAESRCKYSIFPEMS